MRQHERRIVDEGLKTYLLIGNIIEEVGLEIFLNYRSELLLDPTSYIIQALWGAKPNGELSPGQKEINRKILCTLEQIREFFSDANLDLDQQFAMDYLVRGFFSARVMHMTAIFQIEVNEKFTSTFEGLDNGSDLLM
jgi:hypothetical protein